MAMIDWDSYLELGHSLLDEQHRILADVINQLHSASKGTEGRSEIEKCLLLFRDCIEIHDRFEEDLMADCHYLQATHHKGIHSAFLEQLDNLVSDYQEGTLEVNTKMLYSLQEWLVTHIVKEDRPLVRFIQDRKKGTTIQNPPLEIG